MAKKPPKPAGPAQQKPWPADNVQRRPIDELIPYARNARTHSPEQVAQIAASMREWGWTNPVLIDEQGGIIAGHGRVLAARKLGYADVPVMVAAGWTEAQKRAYVIADNKLALNAGWDDATLVGELQTLQDEAFDLSLTGFSADELDKLIGEADDDDDGAGPELQGLRYQILVACKDEAHQVELLEAFEKEGIECRPLIS